MHFLSLELNKNKFIKYLLSYNLIYNILYVFKVTTSHVLGLKRQIDLNDSEIEKLKKIKRKISLNYLQTYMQFSHQVKKDGKNNILRRPNSLLTCTLSKYAH